MKGHSIVESIRLFVMKAQTNKAIDELYHFCNQNNILEFRDQIVLLSSSLNEIKKSELLGLGQYVKEKNRINLSLLQIIQKLDDQIINQEKIITSTSNQNEQILSLENKNLKLFLNSHLIYLLFSKLDLH